MEFEKPDKMTDMQRLCISQVADYQYIDQRLPRGNPEDYQRTTKKHSVNHKKTDRKNMTKCQVFNGNRNQALGNRNQGLGIRNQELGVRK